MARDEPVKRLYQKTKEAVSQWEHGEALKCGMTAEAFWTSSPRAVYLLIHYARRRDRPAPGRKPGPQGVRRVRLNYLPHP